MIKMFLRIFCCLIFVLVIKLLFWNVLVVFGIVFVEVIWVDFLGNVFSVELFLIYIYVNENVIVLLLVELVDDRLYNMDYLFMLNSEYIFEVYVFIGDIEDDIYFSVSVIVIMKEGGKFSLLIELNFCNWRCN